MLQLDVPLLQRQLNLVVGALIQHRLREPLHGDGCGSSSRFGRLLFGTGGRSLRR